MWREGLHLAGLSYKGSRLPRRRRYWHDKTNRCRRRSGWSESREGFLDYMEDLNEA